MIDMHHDAPGPRETAPTQIGGEQPKPDERERSERPERIGVGSNDDSVARLQLAARWAETYAPAEGDSLRAALQRFRAAFEYLDAVTHGIEPPSVDGGEQPH